MKDAIQYGYATALLVLFVTACAPGRKIEPTYKPYPAFAETPADTALRSLMEKMEALAEPVLQTTVVFDSTWSFSPGDKSEAFKARPVEVKGALVDLQHRLLHPDQAFWYSRVLQIDQPGVLTIQADDGAQLFIQGKAVRRIEDNYFPIDSTGRLQVTIRVLNNAMAGGLRHVAFSTRDQFNTYLQARQLYQRQLALVEKIVLLESPTKDMIRLSVEAVSHASWHSMGVAEKALEEYPYLTGPWLQRRDSGKMIIAVETDGKYPVTLGYGMGKELREITQTAADGVVTFELKDIQPDTVYHYMLTSGKTVSPVYTFRTDRNPDQFTFNVWGDSQSGWEGFEQHVRNMAGYDDAFGVGAGDLVGNGSNRAEWRRLFKTLAASAAERPYYLVPGNHDYDGYYADLEPANYKRYLPNVPSNYFAWTYGNCAFIALDPNESFPIGIKSGSTQYRWFQEQIQSEAWRAAQWRFIVLHQPPISQGWAGYEGDAVIRELLEPVIESAGIDFVIAGHTHDYERLTKNYGKQKITFLIVGGGGGSLEPPESSAHPVMDKLIKVHHLGRFYIRKNRLRFEVIDLDKKVIDGFEQQK